MIIGITTTFVEEDREHERVPVERVTIEYIQRVAAAGATPLLLPPVEGNRTKNERAACEIMERIDGLVLAGGGDIDPTRFGDAVQLPETTYVSKTRDDLELALARLAHERDMPTLGICRGMQVMNVARGGTLYQDVNACGLTSIKHQQQPPYENAWQHINVTPGSLLEQSLGNREQSIQVNSMHHQALAHLGVNLQVSARSDDGLIEGIEDPSRRFFLGVQWHPEYLDDHQPLFRALADTARWFAATL